MTAMVWLSVLGLLLPIAGMCGLKNTRGKGKIELYTNEEESTTLVVLTMEGDCVLDFCLEQDSHNSRYCNTNEVFSVLIDGRPKWLCHKQTYAINDPSQ